jgi:hypothetical protein
VKDVDLERGKLVVRDRKVKRGARHQQGKYRREEPRISSPHNAMRRPVDDAARADVGVSQRSGGQECRPTTTLTLSNTR